jgi:RNA polymerase sigma-70 factor (ECF subfamily)
MLLHESRRPARTSPSGDVVLLEDQDRRLWNSDLITEGIRLVGRALTARPTGPYTIQAAIAAVHAEAPSTRETDWAQILGLYDALYRLDPSPVIELNRAVAIAMHRGPEAGLAVVREILDRGDLKNYALAHAAAADFHRRLNQKEEARAAYEKALALTRQEPERRFLQRRIEALS